MARTETWRKTPKGREIREVSWPSSLSIYFDGGLIVWSEEPFPETVFFAVNWPEGSWYKPFTTKDEAIAAWEEKSDG